MLVLADWIDVAERVAIPLGLLLGFFTAWKMGAIRKGYEKGMEFRKRRARKKAEKEAEQDHRDP